MSESVSDSIKTSPYIICKCLACQTFANAFWFKLWTCPIFLSPCIFFKEEVIKLCFDLLLQRNSNTVDLKVLLFYLLFFMNVRTNMKLRLELDVLKVMAVWIYVYQLSFNFACKTCVWFICIAVSQFRDPQKESANKAGCFGGSLIQDTVQGAEQQLSLGLITNGEFCWLLSTCKVRTLQDE